MLKDGKGFNMETIKFQCNWNKKLGCDYFTTLRLNNPGKYAAGNRHKVMLHEKGVWRDYGIAEVVSVRVLRMHQLNEYICGLDTGYPVDETRNILYRMYKDKVKDINLADFALVLYRKEKMKPVQDKLFNQEAMPVSNKETSMS